MEFKIDKDIYEAEDGNVINTTVSEDESSSTEELIEVKTTHFINIDISPNEFMDKLLLRRQRYVNERWENVIIIDARVLNVTQEFVECECLIDKEQYLFQNQVFPKYLFDDIDNLRSRPYVRINMKSKIGSTRIDIFDGRDIVDPKSFDTNHLWKELEGTDLGKPLGNPIK